ncbi:MAG: LysE family transporter [Candidatus Hadarchaeales archaeon]
MYALLQLPIGFFVGLSGSLLPGPMLVYVVAKSSVEGAGVGPRVVVGHLLTEALFLSLFLAGLRVFLKPPVHTSLGLLGGSLLLLLGGMSAKRAAGKLGAEGVPLVSLPPLPGGVLFSSFLNPSVPLWWVTVGFSTLLEAFSLSSYPGVVLWLVGHGLSDLSWFSLVSRLASRGRRIVGTRAHRILLASCGAFLLLFGSFLLLKYLPELIY